MKRITTIALALTIVTTVVFAQEKPPQFMKRGMGPGGEGLASVLGLSADQKTQWDAIHQQLGASIKPLFMQHRAAEEKLQSLVEAPTPDAAAVGTQFLAMRAIDKQIQAAHEATKQKIDAILTPDQKAKFDSIHERMDRGDGPPMMRMHHQEGFQQ